MLLLHLLLVLAAAEGNSGLCSQHKHACCCMNVLLLPYSPSCRLPLLGPLLLPRLALLLLLLQPSCFFSGSTVLRNTSSCFSVLVLCFSESSKQMRAANKSEKGSPLLPFALLDLPLPWQLLSLLSRSRFPGKSPARKARPSSRQIPIWISPYERLRARLVLRPADGLFFVSGGRQCSRCCCSGSGPGCLLLLFLLAGVLQLQLLARHLRKSASCEE